MSCLELFKSAVQMGISVSKQYSKEHCHTWSYVHLTGEVVEQGNTAWVQKNSHPDIGYFNTPMPEKSGMYACMFRNRKMLINLDLRENSFLSGRGCFIFDANALDHIQNPNEWR